MVRQPVPGTRERILGVAARLFSQHGVRAVGMQQVVEESGLGKSPLYREFPSKDDLVAAWLRDWDARWWDQVEAEIAHYDGDPARQLLAMVEVEYRRVQSPRFHGCNFYNTVAEFRDPEHPGRQEALAHIERQRQRMRDLAAQALVPDPDVLADMLMLIVAGLYTTAAAVRADGPAEQGIAAAKALIARYGPASSAESGMSR